MKSKDTAEQSKKTGLVFACLLDGKGSARETGWDEVRGWKPQAGPVWIHLDRSKPDSMRWLRQEAGLDPVACEALLAEETRPRSLVVGEGMLVILRGVNLNEGSEPEDMISVRMWVDSGRIVTLRFRRLRAIEEIRASLRDGKGPTNPGDALVDLNLRLLELMSPVLEDLDERLDTLEGQVARDQSPELRRELGELRRRAIAFRRYLAPQRDVISRLQVEQVPWLSDMHRARLRELCDRLMRYVEDLDAVRERATVTQEELTSRLSEQMNRTMYVLSLVAAIFLPLGLLTGLLGINVGGIPGTDSDIAFTLVCILLVALAVFAAWLFRRFRFF